MRHATRAGIGLLAVLSLSACRAAPPRVYDTPDAVMGGFDGPESVRHDPDQHVYFVSNFGGDGEGLNNDGFISRLRADGTVDSLRFIAGGAAGVTLHMPRGMAMHGDTLWVADVDAVRGFDRRTGSPLATVSFAGQDPGFLNDVTIGGDGAIYVTDTGRNRIYRIARGAVETAFAERALGSPNGIAWEAAGGRFLIGPYSDLALLLSWRPGVGLDTVGSGVGGKYDGVEVIGTDSVLVASQADSSLQLFSGGTSRVVKRLRGAPADIGWDATSRTVAIPYVSRDTVELFRLP